MPPLLLLTDLDGGGELVLVDIFAATSATGRTSLFATLWVDRPLIESLSAVLRPAACSLFFDGCRGDIGTKSN